MEDSFDDKLAQKIKDSFDEAEFPIGEKDWAKFSALIEAENNWLLFVLNQPYLKVAASLLLILGTLVWYMLGVDNNHEAATENDVPQTKQIIEPPGAQEDEKTSLTESSDEVVLEEEVKDRHKKNDIGNLQKIEEGPVSEIPVRNELFTLGNIEKIQIPDSLVFRASNNSIKDKRVFDKRLLTTNSDVSNEEKQILTEKVRQSPPTTLEIEMSGLISYGQFEESISPGISGGVGASIPLSNKISFLTGVYISNQNLKIDETGENLSFESTVGDVHENVYANIFAVDVPLNLRYFFRKKGGTQTYLSAGFSSLTYLQETYYTETSSVKEDIVEESEGEVITRRYIEENTTSSSVTPFSNVDIAALLNISLGFRYDLKGSNDLTIEPYFKYPLSSFTGREIRIGSGGIKLVLNFSGRKK